MKKRCLFFVVLLFVFGFSLYGQALLTDDFTGLTIGANLAGQSSWTKVGTGPDPTIGNATPLTYGGYNGGGSEYVIMPTGSATTSRVYKTFISTPAPVTNTFYYSALIRLTSTTATGDYFLSLSDASTGYFARLFAKTSGAGFVLGISKNANVASATFGPTIWSLNTTYLVVFRYSFITGTINDEIYLWVNPSLTGEPSTASAEAANSSATDVAPATVAQFAWHNRTANNPVGAFDAVRVAYGATSAAAWTNLNASQTSLATEPATQPTNLGFNTITSSSFNVTYSAASPAVDGYIAVRKASSAPTTDPVDGTAYTAGTALGDGTVAYSGSGTSFSESSLTSSTTYYYKIYSFNGSGSTTNYLIGSPLTGNQATSAGITPPTVTTTAISAITTTTASSGGNVTADGGATVTARGVCWSTSSGPVATGNHTTDSGGTGSFTSSLTGLTLSTLYYVRAYATNSVNTSYGDEISFTTNGVAPAAPVAITATGISSSGFTAIWDASSGATSYRVDVSTGSGFSTFVTGYNNLSVSGTTQAVTGLSASTTYYYRVRAVNTWGTSISSNVITTVTLASDPFGGYYNPVVGLSGAALKAGLNTILKTGITQFSYDAVTTQLQYTDEDSTNTSNVIEIYTGWSVPKSSYGGGITDWNKEHTWSKSHGDFGDIAPAGTDLHHLRPCDATVNSGKNNADFDEAGTAFIDNSPPSGYTGDTGCFRTTSPDEIWEPRPQDKGDVARMIFYMAVRYENSTGGTGVDPYNLELVDYIPSAPSASSAYPYYAKLSTLLTWAAADPPDGWERRRNNRIYQRQGNRNPFIDHPEYVTSIWGGTPQAPTVTTAAITSVTTTTASGGGEVTNIGTASVTARGVCWSSAGTPSISDSHTTNGSGIGTFTSSLTGLTAGTLYYVRAYATNSVGTSYGDEVTFTTVKPEPANHVTSFAAGTTTTTTIPLTWTDAVADAYLIKGSAVSFADITPPVDTVVETDAALVHNVAQGTQLYTFTGLTSGGTYYFKIYPYTNSGTNINYKTDGTVPQTSATTAVTVVLTVLPTTMTFSTAYYTYSVAQSATITSSNLSAPIDIASNGTYEYSLTEGGTYTSTLQVASNYNGLVWIKFHPVTVGVFSNTITFTSGVSQASIAASGTSTDPSSTVATDLFISEYLEGSSNNKAIEIFNGTGATVDLTNYTVYLYANGALQSAPTNTLALSGTLANNDVYVIANSSANATILALADITNSVANFNGNDALGLWKESSASYVDIFGRIGENPGTQWGTTPLWTINTTLVRKSTVISGVTANPVSGFPTLVTEWDNYPQDTTTYLGSHTFSPASNVAVAPVINPAGGLQTAAVTVTMLSTTPGAQIRYTTDGNDPTEASSLYGSSFQVSTTTTVKAKTYATGYTASSISSVTYSFSTDVSNIAALRAQTPDTGVYYKLTGEAVLTLQTTVRNAKYIQDATGAILIDDASGIITTPYNLYDGITGITGTLITYGTMLQFVPALNTAAASSNGNTVTPEVVTLAQLNSSYQAKLVKVVGVSFVPATGTFTNPPATNYNITDASGAGILRTAYVDLNYIGTAIPTTEKTITGVILQYNLPQMMYQLVPRSLADFADAAPPAAPLNLVISASGNDVSLNWDDDPSVTSWKVYSSTDPGAAPSSYIYRTTVITNTCTFTGEGAAYPQNYYYVTANR